MKPEAGSDRRLAAADLVGLSADGLADMLEDALAADHAPPPPAADTPPAFAHGGDPYTLEELLSGLPAVEDDRDRAPAGLEPALLLTELEQPTPMIRGGWIAAPDTPDDDDDDDGDSAEDADEDAAPLLASPSLIQELRQADFGAPMDALMDVAEGLAGSACPSAETEEGGDDVLVLTSDFLTAEAEAETDEDTTTQTLGNLMAALHTLAGKQAAAEVEPPAEEAQAVEAPDNAEPDDDVLVLTGGMEVTEPPAETDSTTRTLGDLAAALQALTGQPTSPESEPATDAGLADDDVLVLTDDFLAPEAQPEPPRDAALQGEPAWDPASLTLGNLVAALHALAEDGAPPATPAQPAAPPAGDDTGAEDELVLTDAFLSTAPEPEPTPEPPPEVEPAPDAPPPAAVDAGAVEVLQEQVEAIIAAHLPAGTPSVVKGSLDLPASTDALAVLLSDPPPGRDFVALDALYACWPKATHDSDSRALLAVAQNLSRNFGLPDKLPMASSKAWRMLSPAVFEAEFAQRLADVGLFIADWQKTQRTFLILEFGEIELIEHLFEALHPGYHTDLLAGVMNFKVLSNRRMGLLRRIPTRMKKLVAPMLPDRKEQALMELAHAKALLERVAGSAGFAPIVDTASKALEEIDKVMKATANAAPPPPPGGGGGGMSLGRIG